jgi:hypothetical protein
MGGKSSTLSDIINILYVGRWCPELIPDIEQFLPVAIFKMAATIPQILVTYHYVKLYVSIIIHLEVININVRNFNFPIGFYSNPHLPLNPS